MKNLLQGFVSFYKDAVGPFSMHNSNVIQRRKKNNKETFYWLNNFFQAADEGRKRANALPPLPMEREPTFHRTPRGFVSLQNPDEVHHYLFYQTKYICGWFYFYNIHIWWNHFFYLDYTVSYMYFSLMVLFSIHYLFYADVNKFICSY